MQSADNKFDLVQLAEMVRNRQPLPPAGERLLASRWFGREVSMFLDRCSCMAVYITYISAQALFRCGGSRENPLSALSHYCFIPWIYAPYHRLVAERLGKEHYLIETFNRADNFITAAICPVGPACYGMTFRFLQTLMELQKKLGEPLSEEMILTVAELFEQGADTKTCAVQLVQSHLGYNMVNYIYDGGALEPLDGDKIASLEGTFFLMLKLTPPDGHAAALIKMSDELYYIFDPDVGLFKFNPALCSEYIKLGFERESSRIQQIFSFKTTIR